MELTINAQIVRSAQQCQAKGDVRYYLNSILFAANGDVVSTDGHILFKCPKAFEVPEGFEDTIILINGAVPASANELTFYLDSELVKTDTKKALTFEIVDGIFPDYSRVIPTGQYESASTFVSFNPEYLARLAKIYPDNTVVLYHGETGSTLIRPHDLGELHDSIVVLMPCSTDDDMKGQVFSRLESA